jgi:anti-sigma B factor antagonist
MPVQPDHSPSGGLRVDLAQLGSTTTIEVAGQWDLAGLPAARRVISEALERHPRWIVLDLSQLEFIDSSGLHATIELARRCTAQRTQLVIVPAPCQVQRAFELCGLVEQLPFIAGPLAAAEAIARRRVPKHRGGSPSSAALARRSPAFDPPPAAA